MGKIAPLNQITGLGYDWLKEQVGETLAFNYFALYRIKELEEPKRRDQVYLYLFLFPLFLTEGMILHVFMAHWDNPLLFWQPVWQWALFFLVISLLVFLALFVLEKRNGFYILEKLCFHGIVKDYDGWFVLFVFLTITGWLFYSSFFADAAMGKFLFLLGVLILGLCFAFFRGVEWAYLRYSQLYDRLLWLNSQVENESFRKALEGLYGTRTEFKYSHELFDELKPWTTVESAIQSWKNDGEDWYQKVFVPFFINYLGFWVNFKLSSDLLNLSEKERLQRDVLFLTGYFLAWIAQWVIRGQAREMVTSYIILLLTGVTDYKMYYGLSIVNYFAILFVFISVYLILRSELTVELIEHYKKKRVKQE